MDANRDGATTVWWGGDGRPGQWSWDMQMQSSAEVASAHKVTGLAFISPLDDGGAQREREREVDESWTVPRRLCGGPRRWRLVSSARLTWHVAMAVTDGRCWVVGVGAMNLIPSPGAVSLRVWAAPQSHQRRCSDVHGSAAVALSPWSRPHPHSFLSRQRGTVAWQPVLLTVGEPKAMSGDGQRDENHHPEASVTRHCPGG